MRGLHGLLSGMWRGVAGLTLAATMWGPAAAQGTSQTLTVNAAAPAPQVSAPFDPSHRYRITASGVIAVHGVSLPEHDALYCIDPAPLGGNGAPLCTARSRSGGLRVNGQGLDEFAGVSFPYRSDHIYTFEVSGKTGTVTFMFNDSPGDLFNNSGSYRIVIDDLGPPATPAPAPAAPAPPPPAPLPPAATARPVVLPEPTDIQPVRPEPVPPLPPLPPEAVP
ncbi:MAG: hypothetical protein HW416_775, partial [Chloroflexi bacterium]|nr:hypothetical protein [Chloroflexota bacterium]